MITMSRSRVSAVQCSNGETLMAQESQLVGGRLKIDDAKDTGDRRNISASIRPHHFWTSDTSNLLTCSKLAQSLL